jgi:hypothetical protein|tara:strand:+ start:11522 stop:11743 length:222 start_codon:yes stop_codon:yes gene_type:complete
LHIVVSLDEKQGDPNDRNDDEAQKGERERNQSPTDGAFVQAVPGSGGVDTVGFHFKDSLNLEFIDMTPILYGS